jgi:hypothetical protein
MTYLFVEVQETARYAICPKWFLVLPVNDFGIWNLQAIWASTYENFTDPNAYSLVWK